jgi:uncharacterized membrane protein
MARSTEQRGADETLVGTLRNSPATKQLTKQARGLLEAQADRLAGRVGSGVSSAAERMTHVGETGQLPAIGKGAKRLLQGDSPVKAAVGTATAGVADKAKQLVGGAKGAAKGKGKGTGKQKALNIEESIDIGAPVSVVYDQWTQFQDFSRFTKGVESVEQVSDTETNWRAKVFKSRRTWRAKIQEQIPDRRIVWTSEGSKGSTKGVVTFHPLADDLTLVLVAVEYYPSGLVEKTGNLWRAAGRRTRLDLKNFRRFVMLEREPTGSWRGEIREGKVVKQPDSSESSGRQSGNGKSSGRARKSGDGSRPRKATASASRSGRAESSPEPRPRKSSPRKSGAPPRPRKSSGESSSPRKATSQSRRPRKAVSQRAGGSRKAADTGGGSGSGTSTASRSSRQERPKRKATSSSRTATSGKAKSTPRKRASTR